MLSIQSIRLVDLYHLWDMNLQTNEAVQSLVNVIIKQYTKAKLETYKKQLEK